jgi:hypothetical protein
MRGRLVSGGLGVASSNLAAPTKFRRKISRLENQVCGGFRSVSVGVHRGFKSGDIGPGDKLTRIRARGSRM